MTWQKVQASRGGRGVRGVQAGGVGIVSRQRDAWGQAEVVGIDAGRG